ncbi:MAG TPA: DUF6599 family protein [Pyrinomonadaceae bacterium]|nr:DUF6599 family protein [Pyrinomonadaceae bacterium]
MSLRRFRAASHFAFCASLVTAFVILLSTTSFADSSTDMVEAAKLLPRDLGGFHQTAPVKVPVEKTPANTNLPEIAFSPLSEAITEYASADGEKLAVQYDRFENDSAAYSLFTFLRKSGQGTSLTQIIGTASTVTRDAGLIFFKGPNVVIVRSLAGKTASETALAQLLAASINLSDPDLPVLVKHLPNWEAVEAAAIYIVNPEQLQSTIPSQPVLKEISFDGGAEAVVANYDQSQLVIVEFTTPQLSIDNDSRIWTAIADLKSKGQPTPTAYRRIGNYSVFVFNARDETSANALVDQVKYEQVVQWLGDDPHLYERLQRYFTQTSAGVLVAVLKSSGLSLLLCLAAGALIGMMMFRHRRAQKATMYSDAGGSIRLNLDELTGPANTSRLLKSANSSERDSSNP